MLFVNTFCKINHININFYAMGVNFVAKATHPYPIHNLVHHDLVLIARKQKSLYYRSTITVSVQIFVFIVIPSKFGVFV